MNRFTITPEFWAQAQSLEDYVNTMTQYQSEMRKRLDYVRLSPEQRQPFARLELVRYVLVTTEDWCGDAVFNIPIVARIVEALPRAKLRVIARSSDIAWRDY